ncbi:MAG: right-handed parallel beta-helix repeat-containing protein [Acidimicrobiales bacterium]
MNGRRRPDAPSSTAVRGPGPDARLPPNTQPTVEGITVIPDQVPVRLSDRIADRVADRVADRLADRVADRVADRLADRVADQVADRLADRVAERLADRPLDGAPPPGGDVAPGPTRPNGPDRRWVLLAGAVGLVLMGGLVIAWLRGPDGETPGPASTVVVDPTTTVDTGDAASTGDPGDGAPEVDTDPATRYVDPTNGDDNADGQTPTSAWSDLQTAMDRLIPGETLYLMSGEYRGSTEPGVAHYVMRTDGSEDAWITLAAGPGASPVVVADDGNGISIRGDYVEVAGIEVRGEGFDTVNDYGWGMLIRNSHHVRLRNNHIHDMAVGGISSVESANLEILGNEVHDNSFWGPEQGSGISIWHSVDRGQPADPDGYHDRIIGNTVYRNENKVFSVFRDHDAITDGNGIIVDQSKETGYTGRTLVANNVVFDNGGRGVLVLESSRVDVMFNTTYRNGRTEILEGGPVELAAGRSDDVRIVNNLAWSRPGAPAVGVSESTEVELGGNVLVTDAPSGAATGLDWVTTTPPALETPSVDPATADFRPEPGSSLFGRGIVVTPAVGVDHDGRVRNPAEPAPGAFSG